MHSPTPWVVTWYIPKYNTLYTCRAQFYQNNLHEVLYMETHMHVHIHTHKHTLTHTERNVCMCAHPPAPTPIHTHTHACMHACTHCSRNWVLFGVEILWEEEGFQFGFNRWQGWTCPCDVLPVYTWYMPMPFLCTWSKVGSGRDLWKHNQVILVWLLWIICKSDTFSTVIYNLYFGPFIQHACLLLTIVMLLVLLECCFYILKWMSCQ